MINLRKLSILAFTILISFNSIAADSSSSESSDSCDAETEHQNKYEKWAMEELPSLLEDCGIGKWLISLPDFSLDDLDLFCGYQASDIASYYSSSTSKTSSSKSSSSKSSSSKSSSSTSKSSSSTSKSSSSKSSSSSTTTSESNTTWNPVNIFKTN